MIIAVIEEHEWIGVDTVDIPVAYMHTYLDKDVVMVVKEQLEKLLDIIDSKLYWKYSRIEKVTKVLYVRFQNSLYVGGYMA